MTNKTKDRLRDIWTGTVVGMIISLVIIALVSWRAGAL